MSYQKQLFITIAFILLLASSGIALAQAGAAPNETPNAQSGRLIYNDSCAGCHGFQGMGDGQAVSQIAPNIPTALADRDYLRQAVPAEMYRVITEGRIENLMPPFGEGTENVEPLPEQQRWDAIAYIYSLGTGAGSVESGRVLYEESCLACHGEDGKGEGSQAIELDLAPGDLGDSGYWSAISNQQVFDILEDGSQIPEHDFDAAGFSDDDLWSIVDYIRTFSYDYLDTEAALRPLERATITGSVVNGTTGENFAGEDIVAELRAFDQELRETLLLTTTLDTEGGYQFDLEDVPQNQFFRVSLEYNGVEFGSDFSEITASNSDVELPITVFETSTDPSLLSIARLHQILSFFDGGVGVNELYVVDNNSNMVFVGETGNPDQGTFEIVLPDNAEQVTFQRAFGSLENFIPANELVATDMGWADTFPLRPGPGSAVILASYSLPYDDGATISHPILYPAAEVNLVLPNAGVSLADADQWLDMGQIDMGTTAVSNYRKRDIAAGSDITLLLEGQPDLTATSTGSLLRDNQTELLVGLGVALLVVGLTVVFLRRWRQEPVPSGDQVAYDRDDLLRAIAELDEAYETGLLEPEEYKRDREELKTELMSLWDQKE